MRVSAGALVSCFLCSCVLATVLTNKLKSAHPVLGAKFGELKWADAKTFDRMLIKWKSEYDGDFAALLDFVRFSLTTMRPGKYLIEMQWKRWKPSRLASEPFAGWSSYPSEHNIGFAEEGVWGDSKDDQNML